MKVTNIKTFIVDGGFRPWTFVKIETSDGIVGWGDCTDWGSPAPIAKMVERLSEFVIGEDPLNTEYLWWKLYSFCIRHRFGIAHKAIAGIDSALWDIRGKYYNAPVYQLLGGKLRDEIPLYWTHFGFTRQLFPDAVHKKPLRNLDDLAALCEEAKELGFSNVKTGLCLASLFGYQERKDVGIAMHYEEMRPMMHATRKMFTFLREHLGENIGVGLDVGFSFKLKGAIRLARELEDFDLMWLETESFNPEVTRQIRESTSTPLCLGESLFGTEQYLPYLQQHAVDIIMPDLAWNSITMGKRLADLAHAYEVLVSPHNCHSPMTTLVSAQLSANIPNLYLLEFDYDDVPWRDDLLSQPLEIKNGKLILPKGPGMGTDLIEKELLKHPAGHYITK